jgi:hypothetical protein
MRRVVYGGLGLMVLATGGYLVVYLARWEWQRSLMAGELLLVSLIVLVAVAGAHRLQSLERRLTHLIENQDATGKPPQRQPAADGDGAVRFRWLEPDTYSYKVFIPVLLGAGIIVSGVAALVERASSALGRGQTATRAKLPDALVLPAGGVLAGRTETTRRGRDRKLKVAGVAIALLVAVIAVVQLAELTQDRPDAPVAAAATTLIIQARTDGTAPAAGPLATRLWEYCRGSTRPYLEDGGLVPLAGQRYALVVQPTLGEHALRRLRGCLEDAVIDHGRFSVVSVRHG